MTLLDYKGSLSSVLLGCIKMPWQGKSIKIRACTIIAILSISAVPGALSADTQSETPYEYRIKASFMYQFVNFIDGWKFQKDSEGDKGESTDSDKPIIIGIIGKNPFRDAFVPLKDKKANNKKVILKYFKGFSEFDEGDEKITLHPDIENIKQCDLLFICSSEKQYIRNILEPIQNERILTVADTQGLLEKGVIINFIVEKNRVRFEVNTAGAGRAKLIIRSKLLRLAKRIIMKDDIEEK
jgi:hypothetical protein